MNATEPPSQGRYAVIDGMRLVAAFAVVWIHASASKAGQPLIAFCRFAVPFFVASLVTLSLYRHQQAPTGVTWLVHAQQRLRRLYFPFLVWSALYLVFRLAKHHWMHDGSPINFGLHMLLNGTAHHLWFLPFATLLSFAVHPLGRILASSSLVKRRGLGLIAGAVGVLVALSPPPIELDSIANPSIYWFDMSWCALPAALFAIPVFSFLSGRQHAGLSAAAWATSVVLGISLPFNSENNLLPNLMGTSLCVAALTQRNPSFAKLLSTAGSLSFGVYLSHVALVEGLQALSHSLHLPNSLGTDAAIWFVAASGSAAFVWVGRKVPSLSVLFPR